MPIEPTWNRSLELTRRNSKWRCNIRRNCRLSTDNDIALFATKAESLVAKNGCTAKIEVGWSFRDVYKFQLLLHLLFHSLIFVTLSSILTLIIFCVLYIAESWFPAVNNSVEIVRTIDNHRSKNSQSHFNLVDISNFCFPRKVPKQEKKTNESMTLRGGFLIGALSRK